MVVIVEVEVAEVEVEVDVTDALLAPIFFWYLRSGSPGVLCTEKELTRLRGPSWENVIVGAVVEIVVVATAAAEDLAEIEVFLALALALASMVGAEARMQEEVVIPSYASCVSVTCALCVCSLVASFRV